MMRSFQVAAQHADQIDDNIAPRDRPCDALRIPDIGRDELLLPQRTQRLDAKGARQVALGYAHPGSTLHQGLRDLTAKEAAAAEHRNQTVLHHAFHACPAWGK